MVSERSEWWQTNWSPDLDTAIYDLNSVRRRKSQGSHFQSAELRGVLDRLSYSFIKCKQQHEFLSTGDRGGIEVGEEPTEIQIRAQWILYGMDWGQDRQTCDLIAAVEDLIDLLFDCPRTKLAAYGTLRPGEVNHNIVADIDGIWRDGTITGEVSQVRDYPSFVWKVSGPEVPVKVLFSNSLHEEYPRIDRFEGEFYERVLVPVTIDGFVHVCYVYASSLA